MVELNPRRQISTTLNQNRLALRKQQFTHTRPLQVPVTFQCAMNEHHLEAITLYDRIGIFDDILIYSQTWESHLSHLELVLFTLQQQNKFTYHEQFWKNANQIMGACYFTEGCNYGWEEYRCHFTVSYTSIC